ncbi:35506_t:CDS:1, partial [Gigaspora margarita]
SALSLSHGSGARDSLVHPVFLVYFFRDSLVRPGQDLCHS